jgi:comEA protein
MKKPDNQFSLGLWIESNRLVVGMVLLLLVVVGGGYLIWRENYWKPGIEERLSAQESRIAELEVKLSGAKSEPVAVDPETIVQAITQPAAEVASKPAATVSTPATTKTTVAQSKIVYINTATLADFDSLPGIGPVLSKRIIDYREKNGPFASIEGLKKVSGIGDKTYLKFKDLLAL